MKYSILLPYYDRPQMREAFKAFERLYGNRDDYEIVVIEAPQNFRKKYHTTLRDIIDDHPSLRVRHIQQNKRATLCPGTAYNMGADVAKGKYFIISNPECVHQTDVLAALDEEFDRNPGRYIVAACLGLDKDGKPMQWYQHSVFKDHKLNHCTAISRDNYFAVGGFDEDFADGYSRCDIDFVWKLMNAGIHFVERDDMMTVHLWHERKYDLPEAELHALYAKSIVRLRAKWEGVPIKYNQDWVSKVQEVCW
jgi:GT2 family glycosyltransferase